MLNIGKLKRSSGLVIAILALMIMGQSALAGDDASIKGDLRANIQQSMKQFIDTMAVDSQLYLYDAVDGRLLSLRLKKLHDGIVKKGDYYVSCADFSDADGNIIDVDFLVRPKEGKLITTQALIHSVDGKKRQYHLEG